MERREQGVEIEFHAAAPDQPIELVQAVQHPAVELGQLGEGQALGRPEAVEVADHEAQGVAQTAVDIGVVLQNLGPDAQVL